MPDRRQLRVVSFAVLQLAIATVAALGLYDRGPVAQLGAWITGSDREREALRCAAAVSAEAVQRIPANAVSGPDRHARYAVVRSDPDCVVRRPIGETVDRLVWLIVLVLSASGALRQATRALRRPAGEFEPKPPNESLQQTERPRVCREYTAPRGPLRS